MKNLGLTRRWAGRPGAVERAAEALKRRGKRGELRMNPTIIVVNGEAHHIEGHDFIAYEQVVGLAGMSGSPSMTWKIRGTSEGGILSPGGDVAVREGLVFNVAHTGNA